MSVTTAADGIKEEGVTVREVHVSAITDTIKKLCMEANWNLGGTFEKAALNSKEALFREVGSPNADPAIDALEKELLDRANRLGIGPQGYGDDTTSLGLHVVTYPCHITSLPVAVTIECHAHRHKEATR